jgi:TRAP-type transport system periplasmic protein
MAADLFAALGATPQSIPYAEKYTALATNIVEGNTAANSTQVDTKDYEVCKFTNLWPCDSTEMVDFVSLDAFNALPKEYQTIVAEEMKKASDDCMKKYIALDEQSIKALADKGVTIVTPNAAELAKFMTICNDLQKKWSTAGGQQAIDIYAKVKAAIGY